MHVTRCPLIEVAIRRAEVFSPPPPLGPGHRRVVQAAEKLPVDVCRLKDERALLECLRPRNGRSGQTRPPPAQGHSERHRALSPLLGLEVGLDQSLDDHPIRHPLPAGCVSATSGAASKLPVKAPRNVRRSNIAPLADRID